MASLTHSDEHDTLSLQDAYLSGIFDGEGCVGVYAQPRKDAVCGLTVQLSVQMTDPRPVRLLGEVLGGHVYEDLRPTTSGRKVYGWWACGEAARSVVLRLLPNSHAKRYQLLLALEATSELRRSKTCGRRNRVSPSDARFRLELAAECRRAKEQGDEWRS